MKAKKKAAQNKGTRRDRFPYSVFGKDRLTERKLKNPWGKERERHYQGIIASGDLRKLGLAQIGLAREIARLKLNCRDDRVYLKEKEAKMKSPLEDEPGSQTDMIRRGEVPHWLKGEEWVFEFEKEKVRNYDTVAARMVVLNNEIRSRQRMLTRILDRVGELKKNK